MVDGGALLVRVDPVLAVVRALLVEGLLIIIISSIIIIIIIITSSSSSMMIIIIIISSSSSSRPDRCTPRRGPRSSGSPSRAARCRGSTPLHI